MNKIGHTEESRGDIQRGEKKRAIKFRYIGSDIRPLLITTKDSKPNEYVIQETCPREHSPSFLQALMRTLKRNQSATLRSSFFFLDKISSKLITLWSFVRDQTETATRQIFRGTKRARCTSTTLPSPPLFLGVEKCQKLIT